MYSELFSLVKHASLEFTGEYHMDIVCIELRYVRCSRKNELLKQCFYCLGDQVRRTSKTKTNDLLT